MSRAVLILGSKAVRDKAAAWIANAPVNTRIEFREPKRSAYLADRALTALASGSGDHAELARLAEAATPGEWELDGHQCLSAPDGTIVVDYSCCTRGEWEANAAYLRAVQPSRTIALLAENAALRASVVKANDGFEEYERRFYLEQERATEAERKLAEAVGLLRECLPWVRKITDLYGLVSAWLSREAERG